MLKWEDYRDEKLKDPEFKKAYDELELEYSIMREILKLREESGISQVRLSHMTGISQPDINNLENAQANPSLDTLKKIADAFGKKLVVQFV